MPTNELNQTLATRLDTLMRERGLSNNQLGKKAGVAPNTIANYRNGDSRVFTTAGKPRSAKLAEVEWIADALGMHPLDLLSSDAPRAPPLEAAQARLLQFFDLLPPPEQAALLDEAHQRAVRVLGERMLKNPQFFRKT